VSLPLIDMRVGFPEGVDVWIEAEAAAFGKDKQTIVREVMAEWAKRKAHAYKVAARRLAANGLQADLPGLDADCDGIARIGRR
jgi:hypothetical protein